MCFFFSFMTAFLFLALWQVSEATAKQKPKAEFCFGEWWHLERAVITSCWGCGLRGCALPVYGIPHWNMPRLLADYKLKRTGILLPFSVASLLCWRPLPQISALLTRPSTFCSWIYMSSSYMLFSMHYSQQISRKINIPTGLFLIYYNWHAVINFTWQL